MKKYLLSLIILFSSASFAQAKLGYVDSQTILNQFSEAIKAQGDLDALTNRWTAQMDSMTMSLQQEYQDYQKQAANMPEDKKLKVQQDLVQKEQAILEYRKQKFGQQTGEIFSKQEEIFEPVREKIYNAIQAVAKEEGMQFVFDKSSDVILLYADSAFDITFKVLDKLKRGS